MDLINNPITAPKPLDPNEWLVNVDAKQAFYQAFRQKLISEISTQVQLPEGLVEHYLEYKVDSRCSEGSSSGWGFGSIDDLSRKLEFTCIGLRGVHFPPVDTGQKWDYQSLLEPLHCIQFEDCTFYGQSLLHNAPGLALRFANCVFCHEWRVSNVESCWSIEALFERCVFNQDVVLVGHGEGISFLEGFSAVFENCELKGVCVRHLALEAKLFRNSVEVPSALQKLTVKDSVISRKFAIDNIQGVERLELHSTVFEKKFAMIACGCEALVIKNTNFNGLADFYRSGFQQFLVQKSIFRDFAGFERCVLGVESNSEKKSIALKHVSFYSFLNFRETRFNQALDLRATNRMQEPNFLDAEFSPTALTKTDRETFRIIKHSFDAVGNRIEANKYFAHEMQAYRKELRPKGFWGSFKNFWERLLVTLNGAISGHGQKYVRALAWLVTAVSINALVLVNFKNRWLVLPESFEKVVGPAREIANGFANGFLPLRSLLGDELQPLAFWVLIAMVIISTLTWHVLVAIRRHARR